jgi:uridine phosphorylase
MNFLPPKHYDEASVFQPENLLREARRQKNLPLGTVPARCLLDPDGDIVRYLLDSGRATPDPHWACYHTTLYRFSHRDLEFGVIGCSVGASFAVLLAEQLFVSGCRLLVSITSAGKLYPTDDGPAFLLIKHALRDEGTSVHYLPPHEPARLAEPLRSALLAHFAPLGLPVGPGTSWTTDAPYRETPSAIAVARTLGAVAVEMEAAGLYAFASARRQNVVCYAHLTNAMAQHGDDFEKGAENGSLLSLDVLYHTARCLLP